MNLNECCSGKHVCMRPSSTRHTGHIFHPSIMTLTDLHTYLREVGVGERYGILTLCLAT